MPERSEGKSLLAAPHGHGDDSTMKRKREDLVREATELTSIFGAILRKSELQ